MLFILVCPFVIFIIVGVGRDTVIYLLYSCVIIKYILSTLYASFYNMVLGAIILKQVHELEITQDMKNFVELQLLNDK